VQQAIRELDLSTFLGLLRRVEMAKGKSAVAEKPTKASKKAKNVEVEDEEEEEENPKATKKTAVKGKAETKKAEKAEGYTPNKNSMRDFVLRAFKKGGSAAAIKKRAATLAEKAGIDSLADPKAYKNFDVAWYANFLKSKGLKITVDEENDKYSLDA
jgi:hypothetical protein